jgi:Fumarylacetoacetate (FAA) hydrolase family
MRLATFTHAGTTRIGVITGDAIVDLGRAAPALPHGMVRFLELGDVVTTWTPSGVGGAMQPPRFLQVGDVVRIEIEKLGAIENTVVAEPGEAIL